MERVRDHVRCEEHGWVAAVCPRCPLPPEVEAPVGLQEAPEIGGEATDAPTRAELKIFLLTVRQVLDRVAALEKRLDGDGK